MAVFLDVLPRLGLTEAEVAFAKLKEMAAKAGEESGISFGKGASTGMETLEAAAVKAERTVSDEYRKMTVAAQQYEAQVAKVAEVEAARGKESAAYLAATARQTDMQLKATQAVTDHAAAETAAAGASAKFASAKDNSSRAVTSMAGVLNGIGVASFVGFGAAMGVTASKAADFQQSQQRLVAVTGETSQGLKEVSDGILKLAGNVGTSVGELSDAMLGVEKAGYKGAAGVQVLTAAAQLAKVENADLGEVINGLTTSMNDFGYPTDKAAEVASKLNVAIGDSKVSMSEFTGALHSAEPVAASLGIKYEDLLAVISQGTRSGASADQVTENVRNALNALSGAQKPARDAMAQMGISADDVSQHLGQRGLAGTMQFLSDTIKSKLDPNGLIDVGEFKKNAQELDNMTASLSAMSPAAQQVAEGYRNGTVTAKEFLGALKGASGDDIKRLQDFRKMSDDLNDFSKRFKNGQSTLETYNQALREMTGTVAGQSIALQVTGDHAQATNDEIKKLSETTADHGNVVKGFNETEETLKQKLDEAKAGFGAAATEMGEVFIPMLTGAATALKTTAEFLAEHKDAVRDAMIVVGAFGLTWAAVKVGLAAREVWTTLAGSIDFVVGKFVALRGASATTATAVEADAAAESVALKGVGSAALGALAAIVAVGTEGPNVQKWAEDNIPGAKTLDDLPNPGDAGKWVRDHLFGGDVNHGVADKFGSVPKVFGDQDTGPTNTERRGNAATGGDVVAAARAAVAAASAPTGPMSIPTPGASVDPGVAGSGVGSTAPKAKKGDAKNDPIWIAPADSKDFKSGDTEHGVTGSSIIENGPDFSPKGIGTFFSALLIDLALGNPLGKTMADKQKRGDSAQNPMYVTTVDVDNAQKKLDEAIRSYGPDSTQAKTAAAKLAGTQAAVGTTGGYYNPETGAISARDYTSGGGDIAIPGGGKGAEAWRGTVQQTVDKYAAQMGIPADKKQQWVDSIVSQIGTESHGDPNASNPHDSNGRGGTQDVEGLLQYLPSSYANSGGKLTGLPMMDPVGQIAGALFAPRNADGSPAHGGSGIGGGHGWGPTGYNPAPAAAAPPAADKSGGGGGWYGSILDNLRNDFTGGGGLGPVFKRSPASGGPNTPGPYDNSPAAVAAREAADPAFQHAVGHDVDIHGNPRLAQAGGGMQIVPGPQNPTNYRTASGPIPGGDPFAPGGALSAIPGAPGFTPGIPGAAGGLGPQAPGFAPLSLSKGSSPGGGVGASALLGAGTGAAPKSGGDKPGVGSSVANTPAKWGSGKGAQVSVGSSIIAAAGPLAAMAPGSAQAAQLIDRTIGYGAQVGGIAVEGLMSSLIPGGTGGGGIGDPSKSVLGKIAGGIAGAHKTAPNTAGKVAPPNVNDGADKQQQQPKGGDTTHVGAQNNGVQVMGDMHVSTPDAGAMKTDVMKQNSYPLGTR